MLNVKKLLFIALVLCISQIGQAEEKAKLTGKAELTGKVEQALKDAPLQAVPIGLVLKKKAQQEPIVVVDKSGRTLVIDGGIFKIPQNSVNDIVTRGKRKKGGGSSAPYPPIPSCDYPVGPCTESNYTQACGDGGTQECKQMTCGCSDSEQGLYYVTGAASCGSCTKKEIGGGFDNFPETETPSGW